MPETILIVDPDKTSQRAMVTTLKTANYQTVVANAFAPAAQLLESVRPDLLITAERLGAFSGFELVRRGRLLNPRMAALLVGQSAEAAKERQAARTGIVRLTRPVDSKQLLRCLSDALGSRERRRWTRTTLVGNVLARIGSARARMSNISYGGARLESRIGNFPSRLKLELPTIGVALTARRVWSVTAGSGGARSYGVAFATRDPKTARRWRGLVDKLSRHLPLVGLSCTLTLMSSKWAP